MCCGKMYPSKPSYIYFLLTLWEEMAKVHRFSSAICNLRTFIDLGSTILHIRTLRYRNHADDQRADDPQTIHLLNILHHFTFSLRNQRPLFPNLRCINWGAAIVQEFLSLAPLYGPDITTFIASFQATTTGLQFYADPLLEVGLAIPMQSLRDFFPHLTRLDIDYSPAGLMLELPEIIRMPCEALLQKCIHLVDVRVTLTSGLMYILGQLPCYKVFKAHFANGELTDPFDIEPPC